MMRSPRRSALVGLVLSVWAVSVPAASLTWKSGATTFEWNTTVANWLTGPVTFTDGGVDAVTFANNPSSTIFIGTGATAQDVTPVSTTFLDGSGSWTLSGGGIKGTGAVRGGWDVTGIFTGATSYEFSGGADPYGGWFQYKPTVAGTYHFGTGSITIGGRRGGGYDRFAFSPTVAGCTLTNNFVVAAAGAQQYSPDNGGALTGTFTLNGTLSLIANASWNFAAPVVLSGASRTIALSGTNGSQFQSAVSGSNVLTISQGGNTTAWTDYYWYVGNAATWTVSGFTKDGPGNLSFLAPRNLGSTVTFRTGAAIMGNSASAEDWIPDGATLKFTGGKLFLRGDQPVGAKIETVGSLNINAAYSELRINSKGGGLHTLQSTGALTRANDATALVAMGTNTQIKLPSSPTVYGGGGIAGSTTISIVPWLAGSTSTTDSATGIGGDFGSTFLTFDNGTMSLRPLNTGTEFAANLAGTTATTNVRKVANETLAANASVNSLVMSASGAARTIDGAFKLQVNSGSLLTYSDAWANSNTISTNQLDFNGGEANIFVTGNGYATVKTIISSDITNAAKVIKSGFGALYLTGTNSFTGPLVQNSGGLGGNNAEGVIVRGTLATTDVRIMRDNLVLEAGDNRLNTGTVLMINSGGDLRVNRQFAGDPAVMNQTIRGVVNGPDGGGSLSGSGVYNHTAGYTVGTPTFNLTINTTGASDNYIFSGGISNFTKSGPGAQQVGSTAGNFYINQGILRIAGGYGTPYLQGGIIESAGTSFRDRTYNSNWFIGAGGGGWSSAFSHDIGWGPGGCTVWIAGGSTWGVSPGFVQNGDPLMFNSVYSLGMIRYDGGINLGDAPAGTAYLREFRVGDNPATTADYAAIAGTISGTANDKTLLKTGLGTLWLNNTNTYAGPTRVDAGVLGVGNASAIPGGVALTGGTSNIALNGGVLGLGIGNLVRGLGTGGAQIQWTGSGGFAAYNGARSVNLGNAGATVQWNVNYFVPTGSALILGAGDATGTLTFQNPIDLNGGQRTIQVDNGTLPIDALLSGALTNSTGTGGLTKTGLGTLQLGVAGNSYNGPTNINAGTLLLAGPATLTTSQINVAGGATFGGIGTATTTVSAIGTNATTRAAVSPGQSIGALSVTGNVTLGDYSSLITEINSAGGSDVLNITGNLNLSSLSDRLDLWLTGGATYMTGTYTVATWTGSLTGTFNEIYLNGSPITNFIGGNYFPVYGANSLTLVPEPGALVLLAGAALAALRRRARRG